IPRWGSPPAECFLDASRKLGNKRTRIPHGIEVVKNLGPMALNLREQYAFKRRFPRHAVFARPKTLQDFIIAIGEEGIGVSFKHRFQEMQRTKSIGQKDPTSLVETMRPRCKLVQAP